ncbi:Nitronate monooxygenase [Luteitalea pratensis]|uniref:Nitronate monooxygenase n=1 Tax=Luteitalea pratensis TaxID=1855912 RepID=A0A143PUK0_LUTPR|nr:Nitronate monooxygenase [Luteitalea pratensis]
MIASATVDEARWLEVRGVDAIIAQGLEAGGHRGHFLSDDLTKQTGTFAGTTHLRHSWRQRTASTAGDIERRVAFPGP